MANRDTNPVIEDTATSPPLWRRTMLTTFAMTASRRLVLTKFDDRGYLIVCSEPPPDVGEAFASAVSNLLDVELPIKGVPVKAKDQYARNAATQIMALLTRTQGLQIYRDSMHSLCVDRMNEWRVEDTTTEEASATNTEESGGKKPRMSAYAALQKYYFDESVKLIRHEIENGYHALPGKVGEKVGNNPDIQKTVDIVIQILKAAKSESAAKTESAAGKLKASE